MRKILLLLLLLPAILHSQTVMWDGQSKSIPIGRYVEILEDQSGKLSIDQIRSPEYSSKFKPSNSSILSLGYTDSFFWLRIRIDNRTNDLAILELAQAGLPTADLYYLANDSTVHHIKSGYHTKIDDKPYQTSTQAYPLPPGKMTCFIKLNTNSEPVPVKLHSVKGFQQVSTTQKISYGVYLGLMLFVVLYNLFLFISLRKKLYLIYSGIVVTYIFYSAAVIDGFIVYFVPNLDLKFLYTTIPAIGITLQTIYCLVFLEAKKYSAKTHQIVLWVIAYFATWMVAKFFLPFPVVQPINTVNALISFFTMGYVGIKIGKRGNKMGFYFAITYFIYFSLVAVQAIYINTGSPSYIGGLSFVAYATLAEAFLLSFLLSRRFEWEKEEIEKEKFLAQSKVIEKTQENERIIEEQKDKLEKEVESRTAQLKEMNEVLNQTNSRLLELNDYKESMTAMIVHDFKNLLNTVISFSETTPSPRRLQSIHNSGKYMQNLVMNILDVQKFESVGIKLALGNHPIKHIVWDAIDHLSFMIDQKSIHINVIQTEELVVRCDYGLIHRVIVNILSNAIKHVSIKGNIEIEAHKQDGFVSLSIKDDGIGIPSDKLQMVFEKYTQINEHESGAVRSTGLGLAFCKMAIEAHKGHIGVESELQMGSRFYFSLPELSSPKQTNTTHSIHISFNQTPDLTESEKETLLPFITELQKWEVYDFSEVKNIADQISLIENTNIRLWNNDLVKVLYSGNTESYREFINQ